MEFNVNSPILYVITALLVVVVLAQSVFFLIKALRRSKALGMDQSKIKKTIKTAAIFTIAPAVAIVISVMTLSKKLGLPLPWLRLSVVGSMSYETIAANNALSAMGQSLGSDVPLTAQQYVNVLLVMTISIMVGIWLVPAIGKKLQNGMESLGKRDAKWADIFQNSLFCRLFNFLTRGKNVFLTHKSAKYSLGFGMPRMSEQNKHFILTRVFLDDSVYLFHKRTGAIYELEIRIFLRKIGNPFFTFCSNAVRP